MVATESTMSPLGTKAPDFSLPPALSNTSSAPTEVKSQDTIAAPRIDAKIMLFDMLIRRSATYGQMISTVPAEL